MFRLTFKNYRCFPDEKPAVIELAEGFTALVGPNNSGKSSLLRLFLEFRSLFNHNHFANHGGDPVRINFDISATEDWLEIFHNGNARNLSLEIERLSFREGDLVKLKFTCVRNQPNQAMMEAWLCQDRRDLVKVSRFISPTQAIVGDRISVSCEVSEFQKLFNSLGRSFYIGPFRNAVSEGAARYYDISIGTQFISDWDLWKTGASRSGNEISQKVADDLAHIFSFKRLEINATPDKKALQVIVDGRPYRLRELGAGLAQFIIVLGNVARIRPGLLLIDEPELNLHPSLQIDFLTSLASYASYGVMFASHSVGLARAVSDRIYTFQKQDDVVFVKPFGQTVNFAEFVGEMSFSSFKEIGCDRILLVEGVTEVQAIHQFLRVLRKDHTTVVLPLGGSQLIRGGVQLELGELARLSSNVAVLIDSEYPKAGANLSADRAQFVNECRTLKFKVHVTEKRAFENYLCDRAIKEEKGEKFQALGDFGLLGAASHGWAKSDNWRIARRMTRDEFITTDLGKFLEGL